MNWLDEVLIDRGFAYVARVTVVQAAMMTLQSADADNDKRAWARSVLEGLPIMKKSAAGAADE